MLKMIKFTTKFKSMRRGVWVARLTDLHSKDGSKLSRVGWSNATATVQRHYLLTAFKKNVINIDYLITLALVKE